MNKAKKFIVVMLSLSILLACVPNVLAVTPAEELFGAVADTRQIAARISCSIVFDDDIVWTDCLVEADRDTESIELLYILREENAAGNLVIADTWSDSGEGDYFYNAYKYSPAIEGREYELSIRVGIYNANGLVGYDYVTTSATN